MLQVIDKKQNVGSSVYLPTFCHAREISCYPRRLLRNGAQRGPIMRIYHVHPLRLPTMSTHAEALLDLAHTRGILRSREVEEAGIPRQYLSRLVDRGQLIRIGHGLYQHRGHRVTARHSLAVAAKRVDSGVVCLLSALQFHDLTTQNPRSVWMAIGHKAREPSVDAVNLRVVHMSGEAQTKSIEACEIEGVTVPIYSAAKTVADCFKFRSTVGKDVAIEALKDYVGRGGSVDNLWQFAEVCRVQNVIRPYMEMLV